MRALRTRLTIPDEFVDVASENVSFEEVIEMLRKAIESDRIFLLQIRSLRKQPDDD